MSHLPECYYGEAVRGGYITDCICERLRAAQERGTARAYDQGIAAGIKKENERISKALRKGADFVPYWIWGVIND